MSKVAPLAAAPPRSTSTDARTETGRAAGANRRRQRSELRPHPKEEAMSHARATVLRDGRRPSATRGRRAVRERGRERGGALCDAGGGAFWAADCRGHALRTEDFGRKPAHFVDRHLLELAAGSRGAEAPAPFENLADIEGAPCAG